MSRIIVTGINGFVGKHLVAELKLRGCTVIGVSREAQTHPSISNSVDEYYACDLINPEEVSKLPLSDIDGVINLAGFANVGASFGQENLYMKVNVGVLSIIGEEIVRQNLKTRILAISTGAVYSPNQPLPLSEPSKIITNGSPYALSKIAMEEEATRLRANGLNCIIARPFNHIGPGQELGFLVPDLYKKMITALESGGAVKVGNLSTKRDYTDVRDVVRAYADLILLKDLDYEIYNVCSGSSISGETIFDLLAKNIGDQKNIKAEVDQQFIRSNDPKDLYGDNTNLRNQTNWMPSIPLEQTIKDFVDSKKS